MVVLLALGLGLLVLGVFAARNSARVAQTFGPFVTPRSEEARDGMIVLCAVVCVIMGAVVAIIAIVGLTFVL